MMRDWDREREKEKTFLDQEIILKTTNLWMVFSSAFHWKTLETGAIFDTSL